MLRIAIAAWLGLMAPTAFAACTPSPIHFPAGATATTIQGGIARGETACFALGARTKQYLVVTQTDPGEGNIVLQLYRPGWKIGDDGVTGTALPGAEEGMDAKAWSGLLPANGSYLLVIGTTRGGGAYRMRLEIR